MAHTTTLLILLIIAHFIADFFIQSNKVVVSKNNKKWKSIGLYTHAISAGILSYLAFVFIGNHQQWFIPFVITVTHFFIDLGKTYLKNRPSGGFVIDQLLHLSVIFFCWLIYSCQPICINWTITQDHLFILLAFLIITKPAAVFIGTIVQRWDTISGKNGTNGLEHAGRWIGYLERILILCFIILHSFEGIGFLLAAKSIFRFGELTKTKERALTEYILIGTLLSFTIAIITGIILINLL